MSRYIIVIVGRPNVGKSTLFNRLIGHGEAIVHDLPGVTRDRNYADADWAGKSFTLIDTGGFLPSSSDTIEQAVREHARVAMEEADAIVLLVDAREGLTPLDEEIARILRKADKHLHLVVNKVDSDKQEQDVAQFYRLGLGDPIPVSASLGRRVGDLLDRITDRIAAESPARKDPRLKLAILGRPNVGKSSILNALAGEDRSIVTAIPGTTRDPVDSVVRYYGDEILLIDTAGLRRRSKVKESVEFFSVVRALRSIERCDVAVVVVDATGGVDKQDLRIVESVIGRKRSMVIVVNKWDLVEKDNKTAATFERAIKLKLRKYDHVPVLFVSAKTKQRISRIIELAKAVNVESVKRISTKKLNDVLLEEMKHKPPTSISGKAIKIKHIKQVKTGPPAFMFFVNDPDLIRESYRRYLENVLRKNFGFSGVPVTLYFRGKSR